MSRFLKASFFLLMASSFALGQTSRAKPLISEGYFTGAGQHRLFYRLVGRIENPIVLLHGGPGSNMNAVWLDLEPLASQHSFLMYDQRGGGRSEILSDAKQLRAADHVRDLETLRKRFGLRRMVLAGESWGAGLAALYALEYPQRVNRLLLLGPMPPSRKLVTQRLARTNERTDFSKRLADFRRDLRAAADPVALCRAFFEPYQRALFFDPEAIHRRRGSSCDAPAEGVRNYMVVNDAGFASLGDYDFLPRLRGLRVPALIIEGEQSVTTVSSARAWAEYLPNGRLLLIPNAGHYPQVEQPRLFFPAVETFLRGGWPEGAVKLSKAKV